MKTGQLSALALVLLAGLPSAFAQNKDVKPPRTTTGIPTASGVTRMTQPGNQPAGGGKPAVQPQPSGQPQNGAAQPGGKPATQPSAGTPQGAELTPAPAGATAAPENHTQDDEMVMLPAFAEPVQLSSLVELVARTLKINVAVQGDVPGSVVFNAPIPVKKSNLINLLDRLLEQQSYTITADEFGLYTVHPIGTIPAQVAGERPTTRIIRTPNIRPSQLKQAIEFQVGVPAGRQYAYLDELGVIMLTDSPRKVLAVERVVDKLLAEAVGTTFTRLELKYLAASVARQRALELVGATQQSTSRVGVQPGGEQPGQPAAQRQGALDNLADRLTVDQQGNALIFRGHPEEVAAVEGVLEVIDVPNNLTPKSYTVGTWALSIANIAKNRGLGEITTIEDGSQDVTGAGFSQSSFSAGRGGNNQQFGSTGQATGGGPVMVVDASRGAIIYYATEFQHQQMETLIKEIDPQSERVIIGVYKLHNSTAEDVASVIDGIINNQQPLGTSSLLPNGGATSQPFNRTQRSSRAFPERNTRTGTPAPGTTPTTPGAAGAQGGQPGELSLEGGGYVVADVANNQILVKAAAGQQKEFARLIEKLDLRRPQVYIEATIVAVNWSDEMRLAFETQLINAGGAGGLINTNFGLSNFGTSQIWQPKTVSTSLGGLTGAIIKSDHVPIIVNALQTKANARVLSKPQLLVDDNETASIASLDTQPTTTISQTTAGNVVSSGPDEEAGTKLQVTPHISSGGYLRLEYQAELSSFTGTPTPVGESTVLPSPKQVNTIESASVTVPTDTTVVVGGLNFDSDRLTRAQIPLIGDIPILGLLFQDRHSNYRTTTLYVFLTPRIMRDPTFQDLRLITRGPQGLTKLAPEFPPLRAEMIDVTTHVLPPRMPAALNQELPGGVPQPQSGSTVTPVEPLAPTQPVQIPLPEASPAALPADEEQPRVREQKGNGEAQPARTPKRGF